MYTPTPDFYNDYISHGLILSNGIQLLKKATKKKKKKKSSITVENKIPKEYRKTRTEEKLLMPLGRGLVSAVNGTVEGSKKAHKYIYKYFNKKGKVIYVYGMDGKARIKRMS